MVVLISLVVMPMAEAQDDWQLWMEQRWSVALSPRLKLSGKTEERWRDDASDFYSQVVSLGPSWKALSWLKLDTGYHYQWTEQAGRDTNENRIFMSATPFWSWGAWSFEDRHRLVFSHINGRDDWRYRNKPKLSIELDRGWYQVEPYVADEIFYGARAGEWNRNRLFVGLEKQVTKTLGAEVYYLIQSDRRGRDWDEFHVLGVATNVAF
jgi:hypothetical protein